MLPQKGVSKRPVGSGLQKGVAGNNNLKKMTGISTDIHGAKITFLIFILQSYESLLTKASMAKLELALATGGFLQIKGVPPTLFYNVLHMFYTCFVQEKCFWS
jgi:hypothetical protein